MLTVSHVWGEGTPPSCPEAYMPLNPEDPCCHPVRLAVYNPLETDVADTMSVKQARFTTEFVAMRQADGSHLYQVPRLSGGFGIGPWADFELEDQLQYLKSPDHEFGNHVGMGSLFGKLRMTPFHGNGWRGGVIVGGKLPVGDEERGLSTGEMDVFGKLVLSVCLGDLRLHAYAGVAINDDPQDEGSQNDYLLYGIAAEYPLATWATAVAEFEGSALSETNHNIAEGWAGANNYEARGGFVGPIPFMKSWQWGVTGSAGFGADSPEWGILIGVSTLLGEVCPKHP